MGETILLVDDDPDLLDTISESLIFYGYHINRARDGQQAWEILKTESADIILSDYFMPKMNGNELYELVRRSTRHMDTPFVFMSSMPELIAPVGPYSVLCKPFQVDTLLRTVEKSLVFAAEKLATSGEKIGCPLLLHK